MGSSREQRSALTLSGKSKEGDKGKLPEDVTSAISDYIKNKGQESTMQTQKLNNSKRLAPIAPPVVSKTSDSDTPDT